METPLDFGLILFFKDGSKKSFRNAKDLVNTYGRRWVKENIGKDFKVFSHSEVVLRDCGESYTLKPIYKEYDCKVRGTFGDVVTPEELLIHTEFKRDYYSFSLARAIWRHPQWNGEGPVPGSGKKSNGWYNYFRNPSTHNERKWAQEVCKDEPAPRPKRNAKNLPSSWDDKPITSRRINNWKRFRKTQWKS